MATPLASLIGSTVTFRIVTRLSSEIWWLLKEVVGGVGRHRVSMLAKQSAYSLIFAFPSLFIVLFSVAAIVDNRTEAGLSDALLRLIDEKAPDELEPLLEHLVQHAIAEMSSSTAGLAALFSLLLAVWGVAGAVGTLIYACNRVYGVADRRSYVARKLLTLALTGIGGFLVAAAFVLFTFGRSIGEWVAESTDRQDILVQLVSNARPWAIALVACTLLLLYALAPDVELSMRWIVPGVAGVTGVITLASLGFEYLVRFVDPGSAYGAAGSVLILLWFLYLTSAIVVIGAELNAALARRHDVKLTAFLARHPERWLDRRPEDGAKDPFGP